MAHDRPRIDLARSVPDLVQADAPLTGYTAAIASDRRHHAVATALEAFGARTLSAQTIRTVTPASTEQLRAAVDEALAGPIHEFIVTSNFGARSWIAAARAVGRFDELISRLKTARLLASTPLAADSLREFGLTEIWSTASRLTDDLLRYLHAQPVTGRRIVVQTEGPHLADGCRMLRQDGAQVVEVRTYSCLEPTNSIVMRPLIDQILNRQVDALVILAAPAAVTILAQARREGRIADLLEALAFDVSVAALGAVAASPLTAQGVSVTLAAMPFFDELAAVVRTIMPRRALHLRLGGHHIEVRGQAVMFDKELIPVPPGPMAVLRALARRPGQVLSVANIRRAAANWASADDHAIEMAVSRLRRSLHQTDMIQTVMKRGYRLVAAADTAPPSQPAWPD